MCSIVSELPTQLIGSPGPFWLLVLWRWLIFISLEILLSQVFWNFLMKCFRRDLFYPCWTFQWKLMFIDIFCVCVRERGRERESEYVCPPCFELFLSGCWTSWTGSLTFFHFTFLFFIFRGFDYTFWDMSLTLFSKISFSAFAFQFARVLIHSLTWSCVTALSSCFMSALYSLIIWGS